jgi:hypothetical protein
MNRTGKLTEPTRSHTEKAVNIARARLVIRTAAAVLIGVSVAAAPALTYAQHAGGGGGHVSGGGGGAHFGGAHASAPHFTGGHGYTGYTGYHGAAYGGAHYAGYSHGYSAGHVGTAYYHGAGSAYYHGGAYYGPHFHGAYWGGGYWHGGYWPHVWYGPGWAWFYPVLPIGYATFWWGGAPYYYWNNLYYTWNPNYNGYVVTDPPPAGGATGSYDDGSGSADPSGVTAAPGAPQVGGPAGDAGGTGADVFVYPRNGQSDQQASTDRYECHSWAVNQTGFDPTRSAQSGNGNMADYRRAMIACLDGRGYSAR